MKGPFGMIGFMGLVEWKRKLLSQDWDVGKQTKEAEGIPGLAYNSQAPPCDSINCTACTSWARCVTY